MKKIIIIAVILVLLVVIAFFLWKSRQKTAEPALGQTQVTETKTYSLDEVTKHATQNDCWMAIEGSIYNVTDYITSHPGGEAILQGCGKDATEMFNSRPNDGTSHSGRAQTTLGKYLLGPLTP